MTNVFDIRAYGAVGDGVTDDTEAIRAAFADAAKCGGTVEVPPGRYITGRQKNLIILSNGKNVYPEEIEEYLSRIPDIQESVVLGRKNAQGEVVITALVYPDPTRFEGKEKAEIFEVIKAQITELNKTLPAFKQIRELEIRDTEFEKTTSRKIKRFKVE